MREPGYLSIISVLETNPELTWWWWRPSVKPNMFLLEPLGLLGTAENQAEVSTPLGSTLGVLVMSSGAKIPATTRSCLYIISL